MDSKSSIFLVRWVFVLLVDLLVISNDSALSYLPVGISASCLLSRLLKWSLLLSFKFNERFFMFLARFSGFLSA